MVDNSGSSKAQMPSMSQETGLVGGYPQGGPPGGMKLEAVMEQLQRQQQARLEMERKERRLREAHIMYAQQVAAQQAILAAARASGAGFMGKGMGGGIPGGGLMSRVSNQSSVDSEREDEEDRGRDSGEDEEEEEMMEGDEGSDEEDGSASGLEFLRKQTLALQQGASHLPARPFGSYSASAPKRPLSPPVRVKREPDESLSPAGPQSNAATSPNGQADWSYEDPFKQNGSAAWADDADSARGRGEASRDFAKLYELDSDPNRKEFLDDLFTFMQKRGRTQPLRSYNGAIHKVLETNSEAFLIAEYQPFSHGERILNMMLNSATRKLYVSSRRAVAQVDLERCQLYGDLCQDCILARDPYCGWNGTHCIPATTLIQIPSNGKRVRSSPEIPTDTVDNTIRVPLSSKYYLRCPTKSNHAEYSWHHPGRTNSTPCVHKESQCLLLIESMSPEQEGTYSCVSEERGYRRTLAQYQLQVGSEAVQLTSFTLTWVCQIFILVQTLCG
ncbi:uncharacterized protein FYW47_018753 [Aplochiton taeniatus]